MFKRSGNGRRASKSEFVRPDSADADAGASGQVFKAKYFGSVTVGSDKGAEVALEACLKVKQQLQEPQKVFITVSAKEIKLMDRRTGDVMQNTPLDLVTYSGLNPRDKKEVVYITRSKTGLMYCHVFAVKEKASSIPEAITAAFGQVGSAAASPPSNTPVSSPSMAPANRPSPSTSRQSSSEAVVLSSSAALSSPHLNQAGANPIHRSSSMAIPANGAAGFGGSRQQKHRQTVSSSASAALNRKSSRQALAFDGMYLGHTPVSKTLGKEVVLEAVRKLEEERRLQQEIRKSKGSKKGMPTIDGEPVTVAVNKEGIRTVDRITGDNIMVDYINNVSFTCVPKSDDRTDIFAYISTDEKLGRINCHVFQLPLNEGNRICKAIAEAFQLATEDEKRDGTNPFEVVDPTREPVHGELFRRQIHRRDLKALKAIGAGQYGKVYLALQYVQPGTGEDGTNTIRRAVKILRTAASNADKKEFKREAETMLQFQHPNLVCIVGVALQQKPWLVVIEYLKYGDLRNVLMACKDKGLKMTLPEQLTWCHQLASGMAYMASLRLVHMDLAARNCLLAEYNNIKIADFGLTRPLDPGQDHLMLKERLRLPLKWVALEGLDDKVFSEFSDVWSYGVLCWEIFTYGSVPYQGIRTEDVQAKVREGVRLPQPDNCPDHIYQIFRRCWVADPRSRFTFKQLVGIFDKHLVELRPYELRDIGGALHGEAPRRKTISAASRDAALASARAGRAAVDDELGRSRLGSVSRANPLFSAGESSVDSPPPVRSLPPEPQANTPSRCPRCSRSFSAMEELAIELHLSGCRGGQRSMTLTLSGPHAGSTADSDEPPSLPDKTMPPQQQPDEQHYQKPGPRDEPPKLPEKTISQQTDEQHYQRPPKRERLPSDPRPRASSVTQNCRICGMSLAEETEAGRLLHLDFCQSALALGLPPPKAAAAAPSGTEDDSFALLMAAAESDDDDDEFNPPPEFLQPPPKNRFVGLAGAKERSEYEKPSYANLTMLVEQQEAAKKAQQRNTPSASETIQRLKRQEQLAKERQERAAKLDLSEKSNSLLRVKQKSDALFADSSQQHSKIYAALNPQPIAFQTAHERAEVEEEAVSIGQIGVRSEYASSVQVHKKKKRFGFGGADSEDEEPEEEEERSVIEEPPTFADLHFMAMQNQDDDDDEEFEDEEMDEDELPDFGEFAAEMLQRRAEREAEEAKRREVLRQEFLAQKRREQELLEAEIKVIEERRAKEEKAKEINRDGFVEEAQKRLATELNFGSFVWG